jgi:glycerol-3-phosphate dehydrogenase (NAD(P)+)
MANNATLTQGKFAMLGNGSWGTALAIHLAKQGHAVSLWGREEDLTATLIKERVNTRYLPGIKLPDGIEIQPDLTAALSESKQIIVAVPSHAFASLLKTIKPHWTSAHRLLWVTKGLDATSSEFLHTIAAEILGHEVPMAILSGPSFAKEVAIGLPTAVVVATTNGDWGNDLVQAFAGPQFRVYPSSDLIGIQVGSVLKNIIAVAAGIGDALGFGANARAALIARGMAEMIRFGEKMGAQRETLIGLAGCGDMILTCTDNQSRNRRFGLALGSGKTQDEAVAEIGQVVEAIHNIDQIHELALKKGIEMPISEAVYGVLHQVTTPETAVETLFSRPSKAEYSLANWNKIV